MTRLLSETTLSAIIRSANLVARRHKFLAGLEHLLFDPTDSNVIGERDHLHKILEHELWVFGEGYHLMSSERGLTELLRNHLKLEGLPDRGVTPVKRWDGKSGRADLHLAARHKEHDRIRHLVVELKAPDIVAGRKEIDQVEDYGIAVLSNPAFTGDTTTWDFILVVTDYDDVVRRRILNDDREVGLYLRPEKEPGRPRVRAFVRRWRDVIDENKRRLDFMPFSTTHPLPKGCSTYGRNTVISYLNPCSNLRRAPLRRLRDRPALAPVTHGSGPHDGPDGLSSDRPTRSSHAIPATVPSTIRAVCPQVDHQVGVSRRTCCPGAQQAFVCRGHAGSSVAAWAQAATPAPVRRGGGGLLR